MKDKVFEYENGKTEILYKCDKDNNKEYNKINCDKKYCTNTLNKKYAKDFKENRL